MAWAAGLALATVAPLGCAQDAPEAETLRQPLPLWELGLGIGAITLPEYPGSDEVESYAVPVPYVVFRGDFLRADRDGVRARFLNIPRLELDVSLGATPPVLSDESDARRGMPNILPAIEVGPEIRIHLAGDDKDEDRRRYEWNLNLPLRHSMTWTSGHLVNIGNIAYPHINWKQRFEWLSQRWNFDADIGAYFNDRSYYNYFYQVLPQYATPTRPAYNPSGGYGGWEATVYSWHRIGRIRTGAFLEIGSVGGAAFEGSPLVRRDFTFAAGLVLTYVFWISDEQTSPSSR